MIRFTVTIQPRCNHVEFQKHCIYCNSALLLAKHAIADVLYPRPSGTKVRLDSYLDTSGSRWIPPFHLKEEPEVHPPETGNVV